MYGRCDAISGRVLRAGNAAARLAMPAASAAPVSSGETTAEAAVETVGEPAMETVGEPAVDIPL